MESHNSSLGASPAPDSPTTSHQTRVAKTHPQIKIEPNCLVFPPPHFGRCIQNAVSIYNVSKQPCVFKMRSQNPERYVAKPHVAVVAPESATRIFVTLRDMNTLGLKNLPEDTHDRFRISLKLYDPSTVDASLAPKELWSVLQERGAKVDHEQDLVSYFTKRDTPVGGLVTFFPPTYIPVTPTAQHRGNTERPAESNDAPTTGAAAGAASRALRTDMDDAAKKASPPPAGTGGKKGPAAAVGAPGKGDAASGATGEARKTARGGGGGGAGPSKMPALWIGIAVAAVVVVLLAVIVGVTLRGRGLSAAEAARLQEAEAHLQAETARMHAEQAERERQHAQRMQEHAERVAEGQRQAQEAAAQAERIRVQQQQQQQEEEQRRRAAEEQARAAQEADAERQRLAAQQQAQAAQEAAAEQVRIAQEAAERVRAEQEAAARFQAQQAEAARTQLHHQEQQQQEHHRTVELQGEHAES